ncbi:chromosome transmission fidelity protein 18 homolog isoform X5 [Mesocricetus auratus]|uniref:Chromosome transmission fidelity protein 18 homolog isoform X5 n=1 Tax=Mesocricetus auratus TaxID=10036 RepID=A0ABM2XT93_MESAU|nr:chromosome transmission fidelity protein 18 homolog isoform X5 [Mesocricetus auratus]
MEDYEEDLYGVEDDFHSQFAAELEVLAELEAGTQDLAPSGNLQTPASRPPLTFEEAIAGGDTAPRPCPVRSPANDCRNTRKNVRRDRPGPSTGPMIKRPRLEVVKKLNFEPDMEELLYPDSPPGDITPPPSPEVFPEMLDPGPSDASADKGTMQALPSPRNPVLRRPPVLEDYINVTSTGGERAFLVLRADLAGTGVQNPALNVQWRGRGQLDLLGVPFTSLKEQVDNVRRQQQLEEAQELSDTLHSLGSERVEALLEGTPEEEPASGQDTTQHCLWVDEFAPQHYTELLSDDFTNRCLLKWLKLWDLVVFGHERPARKARPSLEPARVGKEATAPGKWKSHEQVLEEMLEAELDPSRRPRQKVALLCGPPGLGKTTLAHVVARHAGYCVVEMNARFTPSLRQLKQQAFLLHVPPTLPSRLVQRLQEISLQHGMRSDPGALTALCEKTDNDIRACINTLQFLYGRGRRELSVRDVQTTHVGLKDQRKGLFSVWQEVFQLPRAQRRLVGQDLILPTHALLLNDGDKGSLTLASQRFYHILRVTTSAGEHEKVVQGLFDNFLRLRLRDSSLGTVCCALDWLAFDDLLEQAAHHGQSFQLLRYLPFLPAAFHVLFASSHVPRITFPSSQQEAQTRMSQTKNHIQTLVSGMAPSTRSRATPQALVLDTLCLLLDVLAPKLRPVSTQLYSAREKQQLSSLVGTMLAYSLTYHQERTPDGQYFYRLEPNVEEVCRFPELPARKPLTYQAKQLIAREIEMEKMRRAEALAWAGGGPQVDQGPSGPASLQTNSGDKGARQPAPHNHEQRLEHIVKKAVVQEQPERDFFGRVVMRRVAVPSREAEAPEKDTDEWRMGVAVGRSEVWFRFNEGVSNAVRRSLYIRDLL